MTQTTRDFLLEIGCEEIPASYTQPAVDALQTALNTLLAQSKLTTGESSVAATPRRLTVFISDIATQQADETVLVSGPPEKAAFKDGQPTKAAEGFAKKNGKQASDIELVDTDKGKYCQLTIEQKGQSTADILRQAIPEIIAKLPSPKSMTWEKSGQKFARPIRSLAVLFGNDVLDCQSFEVKSDRNTHGHPFLSPGPIALKDANKADYLNVLKDNFVIADISTRHQVISNVVNDYAKKHKLNINEPELLTEVTHLVEFPSLVVGHFDDKFLEMPAGILETSMKNHQRYFPIYDANNIITNQFITISNRAAQSAEVVTKGNERVLRARLEDGLFFWESDSKKDFSALRDDLKKVVFYDKLGSYFDKVERVSNLGVFLAQSIDTEPELLRQIRSAALLYRNDLVTDVVYEFPELQGSHGKALADFNKMPSEVAQAIEESYLPKYAGDNLPSSTTGLILSLADKLDSLCGFFSINKIPTGNQDPFALRRQTIGILRMLIESNLDLSLNQAISVCLDLHKTENKQEVTQKLETFIGERLQVYLTDKGYRKDCIQAVQSKTSTSLSTMIKHLDFISEEIKSDHFTDLAALVTRARNISKAVKADAAVVSSDLLEQDEELRLWRCYERNAAEIQKHVDAGELSEASKAYVNAFRHPVNEFFEKVFVSVDDEKMRNNRLSLIYKVQALYSDNLADLSKIVTA